MLVTAVGSLYVTMYPIILLIPTFVTLSDGQAVRLSLVAAHKWLSDHTTLALTMTLLTLLTLLLSLIMTVAFILVIPSVAFLLHVEIADFESWSRRESHPIGAVE